MSHEQTEIWLESGSIEVDSELAYIIQELNRNDLPTRASCQNYGEYLRDLGDMGHMLFSKVDYGYIEFNTVEQAIGFIDFVRTYVSQIDPLFFRLSHQGTPNAWELRLVLEWDVWWVMFPYEDIAVMEALFRDD